MRSQIHLSAKRVQWTQHINHSSYNREVDERSGKVFHLENRLSDWYRKSSGMPKGYSELGKPYSVLMRAMFLWVGISCCRTSSKSQWTIVWQYCHCVTKRFVMVIRMINKVYVGLKGGRKRTRGVLRGRPTCPNLFNRPTVAENLFLL